MAGEKRSNRANAPRESLPFALAWSRRARRPDLFHSLPARGREDPHVAFDKLKNLKPALVEVLPAVPFRII